MIGRTWFNDDYQPLERSAHISCAVDVRPAWVNAVPSFSRQFRTMWRTLHGLVRRGRMVVLFESEVLRRCGPPYWCGLLPKGVVSKRALSPPGRAWGMVGCLLP